MALGDLGRQPPAPEAEAGEREGRSSAWTWHEVGWRKKIRELSPIEHPLLNSLGRGEKYVFLRESRSERMRALLLASTVRLQGHPPIVWRGFQCRTNGLANVIRHHFAGIVGHVGVSFS